VIPKEKIPEERICVKSKWVFNIKRNEIFRERFMAFGYKQVPGVEVMLQLLMIYHS
jgi:hypothetical protein